MQKCTVADVARVLGCNITSIVLGMGIPTVTAWHIESGTTKSLLVSVVETMRFQKPRVYQLGKTKVMLR